MILNFSNEDVNTNKELPSIFLAGPTYRDEEYDKSWRKEAVRILEDMGFNGIVYIPEYPEGVSNEYYDIEIQSHWEWDALDNASCIMFWVPRQLDKLPGFTTNIEFGRYSAIKPDRVVLGYPRGAEKMSYMNLLYRELTGYVPQTTLKETCAVAKMVAERFVDEYI